MIDNVEIERKFLIAYPDEEKLSALPSARISDIVQTYLHTNEGDLRVREWRENGEVKYIRTYKEKLSGIRRIEIEEEITEEEYRELLKSARYKPLLKRRYTIPYGTHKAEIDIYPFWSDRAILEIELQSEHEKFDLPDFVEVIREVTGDREYKNPVLAMTQGANPPPLYRESESGRSR